MVIDGNGQVALLSYLKVKMGQGTVGTGGLGTNRADSVDISAAALAQVVGSDQAVAMPQLLVNEEVVRWSMARLFMETLFGDQNGAGQAAEEGLADAVTGDAMTEDASFDALLQEASNNNGRGQSLF